MITLAVTGHKSTETTSSSTTRAGRIGVASLGLEVDDHACSVHRNSFLSFPVPTACLLIPFCFPLFTLFSYHIARRLESVFITVFSLEEGGGGRNRMHQQGTKHHKGVRTKSMELYPSMN
jgi:hypothetical protein